MTVDVTSKVHPDPAIEREAKLRWAEEARAFVRVELRSLRPLDAIRREVAATWLADFSNPHERN